MSPKQIYDFEIHCEVVVDKTKGRINYLLLNIGGIRNESPQLIGFQLIQHKLEYKRKSIKLNTSEIARTVYSTI